MGEYEILQTNLSPQKPGHVHFVGVQSTEKYLKVTYLQKIIFKSMFIYVTYKQHLLEHPTYYNRYIQVYNIKLHIQISTPVDP